MQSHPLRVRGLKLHGEKCPGTFISVAPIKDATLMHMYQLPTNVCFDPRTSVRYDEDCVKFTHLLIHVSVPVKDATYS